MRVSKAVVALAGACALAFLSGAVEAQTLEKKDLTLGVGGKGLLYYLPLTIAEQRGYFKEQGLNITINDFRGGAESLRSLVGGSVDVVTGAYEHTIRMQSKGQDIRAVIELGRFPGMVLAVKKDKAAQVKSFKDLKGFKVGVTAPGSSTNFFVNALIAKDGLKPEDISIIGVGAGPSAVAAIKKGDIDAIVNLDPVITKLVTDGDIVIIADSRTEEGNMKLFGGNNPAAVVYLRQEFIDRNPHTTQALTNAFYKALKWLETATPDDVAKTVPETFYLGDRPLYLKAVAATRAMYSRTGVVTEQGMKNAHGMLVQFDKELADAKVDLSKTFDGRFVQKAAATVK